MLKNIYMHLIAVGKLHEGRRMEQIGEREFSLRLE